MIFSFVLDYVVLELTINHNYCRSSELTDWCYDFLSGLRIVIVALQKN